LFAVAVAAHKREKEAAVNSDRLMIWRFAAAPKELRSLHCEQGTPEWLVWIPRALTCPDLDELILRGSTPKEVARYETPEHDIVYIGMSHLDRLSQGLRRLHCGNDD
jgi:hypothetical protein